MKALEILKDNLEKAECYIGTTILHSDALKAWVEIIREHKEAIAELEALQQPRTCDKYKHCHPEDLYVGYCEELSTDVN